MPTADGGMIRTGQLLRSDNLQSLTEADIDQLLRMGLTDVVDLRSDYEVAAEGRHALSDHPRVSMHQHSMFQEWQVGVGQDKPDVRPEVMPEKALPWVDLNPSAAVDDTVASHYLSYVADRPDSVLASLRAIAHAPGAVLVHCAAGKDRTGTIVAFALSVAGADRDAIIEDYVASTERMEAIIDRLMNTATYSENLRDRPMSSHITRPETMFALLRHIDTQHGGIEQLLRSLGWTTQDTARMRAKLVAAE